MNCTIEATRSTGYINGHRKDYQAALGKENSAEGEKKRLGASWSFEGNIEKW